MKDLIQMKVIDAMNSPFIGDTIFDDEELAEMKEFCKSALRRRNYAYPRCFQNDEICVMIVLVVNIAKNWGNDEGENRFWTKILNDIFDDSSVKPNMLYSDFEDCLKHFGKVVFVSPKGKRMVREVLLFHAFAPKVSNRAFIELLWNWYMDADVIDEGNNPMYSFIVRYLSKKFNGDIDNLDSDTILEGKTYTLRAALKYGIMQDSLTTIKLVEKLIRYFDEIYHENKDVNEGHFAVECNDAINEILVRSGIKREESKKKEKELVISDIDKLKTMSLYEFTEDKQVNFFIPEIRGIEEQYEMAKVQIFSSNKIIYEKKSYIVGKEIKKRLKRIEIPFCELVKDFDMTFDLRVKLHFDDDLIFDSAERLHREFLLFRNAREVRGDCKPDIYFLMHTINMILPKLTNCVTSGIGSNYIVSIDAREGQYVSNGNKTIFFNSSKQNAHIIFEPKPLEKLVYTEEGNDYNVFTKTHKCTIRIDKTYDSNKIIIIHNKSEIIKLVDIVDTDKSNLIYGFDMHSIGWDNGGCHSILLKDLSSEKILGSYSYIIISSLNFSMSSDYAFGCDSVATNCSIMDENIFCEKLTNRNNKASYGFRNGIITVEVPSIKWRIDSGDWQTNMLSNRLWKNNQYLHNNSIIEIENKSDCEVSLVDSENVKLQRNSSGKFLVGDFLLHNITKIKNEIYLKVKKNEYLLFAVYSENSLVDFDSSCIVYEDGFLKLNFESNFIGEDNPILQLNLTGEDANYSFNTTLKNEIECKIKDGQYKVTISTIEEGIFESKIVELASYDIVLGNPDKFCFINKTIELISTKKEIGKLKFASCKLTNLEYIKEENSKSIYSASLSMPGNKASQVEVEKIDNRVLRIYFVCGDEIISANIDDSLKQLTCKDINNKNILPCKSCYYKVEE